MAAAKGTSAGTGRAHAAQNMLRDLQGIATQLQEAIRQLEAVVERLGGPAAAEEGAVQLRVVEGRGGHGGGRHESRNGGHPHAGSRPEHGDRKGEHAPEAPAAQAVAGQIRGLLDQLKSAPGGEMPPALADQLRSIVERVGSAKPAGGGSEGHAPAGGQPAQRGAASAH